MTPTPDVDLRSHTPCPACAQAFHHGHSEGARGERERIAAYWQQTAQDHQTIANEKRQRAMEAYDDGDQKLYQTSMDLAKTYYRVARETADGLRAERGTR